MRNVNSRKRAEQLVTKTDTERSTKRAEEKERRVAKRVQDTPRRTTPQFLPLTHQPKGGGPSPPAGCGRAKAVFAGFSAVRSSLTQGICFGPDGLFLH